MTRWHAFFRVAAVGSHQRHRSTAKLPQPRGASRQSAQGVSAVSWSGPPRGCGAHGWMIPGKVFFSPGRWTWKLRIQPWKRWNIFQTTIFRFYVNPWDVMGGFKVWIYGPPFGCQISAVCLWWLRGSNFRRLEDSGKNPGVLKGCHPKLWFWSDFPTKSYLSCTCITRVIGWTNPNHNGKWLVITL